MKMKSTLLDFLILLALALVLMAFGAFLSGCVSVQYEAEQGRERLEVKTLFKSIDGLWAERQDEDFSLIVDKTYTHDPLRGISELLETYEDLYGMGLRYEPAPLVPDDP